MIENGKDHVAEKTEGKKGCKDGRRREEMR
jgi:hypothetical protein